MISDDDIGAVLDPLRPIAWAKIPFEGEWVRSPFLERIVDGRPAVVICEDPGLAMLIVDRATALEDADGLDPDDSRSLKRLAAALLATFMEIDPDAMADENGLWPVAAEELGYDL